MNDEVDRLIRKEAKRFVEKDRSKLKLTLGLYALSLNNRELGKIARASYFFVRHLDDLLDGETQIATDPVEYALDLKDQVEKGKFNSKWPIAKLAAYSLPILEGKARPDDNPREEFARVIDTMIFDYYRRFRREPLSGNYLRTYYSNALDPGLNLLLIGLESDIRAKDIPDFSPSLGRLYSIRDFEKDWELGIINVPDHILTEAMLSTDSSYTKVIHNPLIHRWTEHEIVESVANLLPTYSYVESRQEPLTQKIIQGLSDNAIKSVA